jgi:hypothetical protein
VVGKGSITAPKWNRPLMQSRQMREQYVPTSRETCFQILSKLSWYVSIARLLLFFLSVLFTAPPFIVQASVPAIFTDIYGLDELQVGLCYLSIGTGVITGGLVNVK